MRSLMLSAALLLLCLSAVGAAAGTEITDQAEAEKLRGEHLFSLQWIGWWEYFGMAVVSEDQDGTWRIEAEQRMAHFDGPEDYVTLKGTITRIETGVFTVEGELVTRVQGNNGGQACVRQETFHFRAMGDRKYWRLKEKDNPCPDGQTDYVDVFFN